MKRKIKLQQTLQNWQQLPLEVSFKEVKKWVQQQPSLPLRPTFIQRLLTAFSKN